MDTNCVSLSVSSKKQSLFKTQLSLLVQRMDIRLFLGVKTRYLSPSPSLILEWSLMVRWFTEWAESLESTPKPDAAHSVKFCFSFSPVSTLPSVFLDRAKEERRVVTGLYNIVPLPLSVPSLSLSKNTGGRVVTGLYIGARLYLRRQLWWVALLYIVPLPLSLLYILIETMKDGEW